MSSENSRTISEGFDAEITRVTENMIMMIILKYKLKMRSTKHTFY